MRALGIMLTLAGLAPLAAALGAESLAHALPGCTANEIGATGCVLFGRPINGVLAHGFDGVGLIPWLLPVGFLGAALLLGDWSRRRAAQRRARHR